MPDHLGIDQAPGALALVMGNPDRIEIVADELGGSTRELTRARGFVCTECDLGDQKLVLVSTGIGGPSTAIAVEELAEIGVTQVVRLGTCGALQTDISPGDLILSTASVRDEGTTRQYLPDCFPAVADTCLVHSLGEAAEIQGVPIQIGVTHCKDAYYLERKEKMLRPSFVLDRWQMWRRAGVLATEMEVASLFVVGGLRGLRTGAMLVAVGESMCQLLLERSTRAATRVVQAALPSLAELEPRKLHARSGSDRGSFLDDRSND